jgi:hypothetical protein
VTQWVQASSIQGQFWNIILHSNVR